MINLDDMDTEDLENAADNLYKLHRYATIKRVAIQSRHQGLIMQALRCEQKCQELYLQLDPEYQW